jgi:peptidoglycan/xylan/chitin deacetylase (PgdA/CDA1 family)
MSVPGFGVEYVILDGIKQVDLTGSLMTQPRRRLVAPLVTSAALLLAPLPLAAGLAASNLPTAATEDAIAAAPDPANEYTWRSLGQTFESGGESLASPADPSAVPAASPELPASTPTAAPPNPLTPPAPVPAEVIARSETGRPEVAITLDADLSPWTLNKVRQGSLPAQVNVAVLDYLEQSGTPSTVFVTGLWALEYPGVMTRMAESPLYELANHSWGHDAWTPHCYGLPLLTGDPVAEVADTSRLIASYTGEWPDFFRFPGLCHDPADVAVVASQGARTVDYDLDGSDAFAANPAAVAASLADQARAGSIIVLHLNGAPNAAHTAEILASLVPALEVKGLTPVTISQLMAQ